MRAAVLAEFGAPLSVREVPEVRAGGDDLALPYPWLMRNSVTVRGQWMLPRAANVGLVRLVASGRLDLGPERVRAFRLEAVNEAVAYAAAHPGAFERTALVPSAG